VIWWAEAAVMLSDTIKVGSQSMTVADLLQLLLEGLGELKQNQESLQRSVERLTSVGELLHQRVNVLEQRGVGVMTVTEVEATVE